MAEKTEKESQKILCPDLTQAKKVLLAQTMMTPGWKVVIEIANDACLQATQYPTKLDPESSDYERRVVERQRRARNIIEFSDLLFRSTQAHTDSITRHEAQEDDEAVTRVAERFGIHPSEKGTKVDAITKTFGIHPARPVKAKK